MTARGWRWQAFGDTITSPDEGVQSYVALAKAEHRALGLAEVINGGVPGWTSADLRRAIEGETTGGPHGEVRDGPHGESPGESGAGVSADPRLVSIMIGTFDHVIDPGQTEPRVSPGEYRENVAAMLRTILGWTSLGRRLDGGPSLIVLTPPFCMTGTNRAGLGLSQERLSEYCAILLQLAEESGAVLVDTHTIFGTSVRWSDERLTRVWTENGDGLTLNTLAHKLIYPYIRGAVQACVNPGSRD